MMMMNARNVRNAHHTHTHNSAVADVAFVNSFQFVIEFRSS